VAKKFNRLEVKKSLENRQAQKLLVKYSNQVATCGQPSNQQRVT
jgi:hypothetical protein